MESKSVQNSQTQANPKTIHAYQSHMLTPESLRDKYTFEREIGHGTQGRIYLAKRNEDGLMVAIKQLNIESVKNWKAYDLFRRESDVLASLDIPGVAKFYDAIECLDDDPPCSYIVQEFIEGKSLAEMIKSGHRFALNRVYDIILQLLAILKQLHAHVPPVIHRDIKPSNILLKPLSGDDYQIYLIDFGAVANPQVQGGGSTVAGTFGYMAPEQMMGKPEPASDIYSLGAVAVHLISGRSPADMPVKDFHLIFEPEMQNMPPALVATLRRMLAPNAADRLCDIDVLSGLFTAFSESIYSSQSHFSGESMSEGEFEARLKAVEYYGQEGNLELWQRLPDETPRQVAEFVSNPPMQLSGETYDFPESAENKEKNRQLQQLGLEDDLWEKWTANVFGLLVSIPFIAIPIGVLLFMLGFPFGMLISSIVEIATGIPVFDLFTNLFDGGSNLSFFLRFYLAGLLVELLVLGILFIKHQIRNIKNNYVASANAKKLKLSLIEKQYMPTDLSVLLHNSLNYLDCNLQKLLSTGRKTIATVVKIKYVNAEASHVETQISKTHGKVCPCEYSCHGRPRFVISYKFNPPDDAREEDIIHKISTYTDVEEHLKPGDPLPIIYRIVPRGEWIAAGVQGASVIGIRERVVSMPFPFPLGDPLHLSDIMYCDEAPISFEDDDPDKPDELFMEKNLYTSVQNTLSHIVQKRESQKKGRIGRTQEGLTENASRKRDNLDDLFNELIKR